MQHVIEEYQNVSKQAAKQPGAIHRRFACVSVETMTCSWPSWIHGVGLLFS